MTKKYNEDLLSADDPYVLDIEMDSVKDDVLTANADHNRKIKKCPEDTVTRTNVSTDDY